MTNPIKIDLRHILNRPIPGHSIAVFRIAMGALLFFESINYGLFLCLDCMYRETELLFKYQYFDWVVLPPGRGLELMFFVIGVSSVGVMLGVAYRVCIVVLTLVFAWIFFLDAALYLNHYYLTLLFLGILCVVPAHRVWAVGARKRVEYPYIGNWARIWFLVQLEIVLLYAGLVKLNSDWLQLEPLRLWMTRLSHEEYEVLQWLTQDPGIALGAYGVIVLHLLGAPLLLFRKTRLPTFFIYVIFHCINATVFNIGIFPFMTIAATTLVFEPDWPLKFWHRINGKKAAVSDQLPTSVPHQDYGHRFKAGPVTTGFVVLWITLQLVLPTRPLWYDGPVAWNEAGHKFSWRMKLRDKRGKLVFTVKNLTNETSRQVNPEDYLNSFQVHKMSCNPDLIWQFAQYLVQEARGVNSAFITSSNDFSVTVVSTCSLNTRPAVAYINPDINLALIDRSTPREQWLMPLNEPLPKR